ncbi:MAG TPA: thioredoxin domain-containing protein [Spirochaetia bacterium]|nr:thioredoxin domain-containing protein [Spirochaetia bacterium]
MNRLAAEKSPYLLQHAENPVDWYPWGREAFEAARREDKPIFLSIGYSTCHWCHVMEHESFSHPQVARLMNEVFISIKVDREERPDLDEHFMNVSRLLTGSGGWPLTVFLTSDGQAFYSATYIPRENAYGRLGMLDLVPRIRELWTTRRDEVARSAEAVSAELANLGDGVGSSGFAPLREAAAQAARALSASYDSRYGGFGTAPKFPMPTLFGLLLRAWRRSGDEETLGMAERTLAAMRSGGIYDQVGFGFHRYSTDPRWLVPHFEKMLYDQALQCIAYTEAWQATGKDAWRATAREICAYVLRDLLLPEGGFATAEDADSEGEEGAFYLWTPEQVQAVLGDRAADFLRRYELADGLLHRPIEDQGPPGEDEAALLAARASRVRPLRDDKLLADWNGLMIAALAHAGGAFQEPELVAAAERAARLILSAMRTSGGDLLHRRRAGESAIGAFADDYAFVAWGLLELYEATFDPSWLQECVQLVDRFIGMFWDDEGSGFYSTADGSEIARTRPFTDGVIPSANSVGALLLVKLNRLTGRTDYQRKAERLLALFPELAANNPISFSFLLTAADFAAGPSFEVVIAGDPDAADTRALLAALRGAWHPNAVVLLAPTGEGREVIAKLAPYAAAMQPINGKAAAYVCRNFTCSLPTSDPQVMLGLLRAE